MCSHSAAGLLLLAGIMLIYRIEAQAAGMACDCPLDPVPMCATSVNKTYGSPCMARCAGVTQLAAGACPKEAPSNQCVCDALLQPHCAAGAADYSSECEARCAGATRIKRGPCGGDACTRCTTEYKPVCGADNSTYSNHCRAECVLGAGQWREGRCPADELNPVAGCIGNARCAGDACAQPWPSKCQNKLPPGALCFTNPCTGISYGGQLLNACEALWVDPATKQLVRCSGPAPKPPLCNCTRERIPVCGSDGMTYDNKCLAACALGVAGKWSSGECPKRPPACICTMEHMPVCGNDGKTYDNKCLAACALGTDGKWSNGTCKPVCVCTREMAPVCGSDRKTYNNKCLAACALGTDGKWSEGACKPPCMCAAEDKQVCDRNGNTYANKCQAACALGAEGVWSEGACTPPPRPCMCTMELAPVCSTANVTYGNKCAAGCAGAHVAYTRECGGVAETVSCPRNKTVACLADPCAVASCPSAPSAACLASYCAAGEGRYRGQPLPGACEAVFVDDRSGDRVNCTAASGTDTGGGDGGGSSGYGNITRIEDCPPNGPLALCLEDASKICGPPRACPAHPAAACTVKVCPARYRGQLLKPCAAIWYLPASGDVVNCTSSSNNSSNSSGGGGSSGGNSSTGGGKPVCASCSQGYSAVCTTDKKTYPNECAALCQGKAVARAGKCGRCSGADCTHAKRNELCMVGSSGQCWAKKYECRLPEDAEAGTFLGTCLPKPKIKAASGSTSTSTSTSSVSTSEVQDGDAVVGRRL